DAARPPLAGLARFHRGKSVHCTRVRRPRPRETSAAVIPRQEDMDAGRSVGRMGIGCSALLVALMGSVVFAGCEGPIDAARATYADAGGRTAPFDSSYHPDAGIDTGPAIDDWDKVEDRPTSPVTTIDLGHVLPGTEMGFTVPANTLGFNVSIEATRLWPKVAVVEVKSPSETKLLNS